MQLVDAPSTPKASPSDADHTKLLAQQLDSPGEPPGPARVPLFGEACWGHPEAGSSVTDAQLQRVFDNGMDPAAMVNAGWWFVPRLPRSGSEAYRWTANIPEVESVQVKVPVTKKLKFK